MDIALIVHDCDPGVGHGGYTVELARHLGTRHRVAVFAHGFAATAQHEPVIEHHHVAAWRWRALTSVYSFPLGLRVQARRLAAFDIRHAQGYCGGDPNVVTVHMCVAAYRRALGDHGVARAPSLAMMEWAERRFYRRYRGALIAPSQRALDDIRQHYGFRGAGRVIPHGVDAARFHPVGAAQRRHLRQRLGLPAAARVLLYVGDLVKARAALAALAARLDADTRMVVVSRSRGLDWRDDKTLFAGATAQPEDYFRAADLFVYPSAYDTFGLVVLEAMACGLPVCTTTACGASELIEHGVDGWIWPPERWLEATTALLGGSTDTARVGAAAARCAAQYNWERTVADTEACYRDCVADSG